MGLIIVQIILLLLGLANLLSLFLSSPIVIALALITSYVLYARQSGERVRKVLRDLKRHVDDFARVNFDAKKEGEDFRVIKLIDKIVFPKVSDASWDDIRVLGTEVQNLHVVFQLWHSTIQHKVDLMSRKETSPLEYDLGKVIEDLTILYDNYVNAVAEKILSTLNKVPVLEKANEIRSMLNVYRENLGHLKERINTFINDLRESGYRFQMAEVKALKGDLTTRWG